MRTAIESIRFDNCRKRCLNNLLHNILEKEIVPLFYERNSEGLPLGWLTKMKKSIMTYGPQFSSHRMVQDYCNNFYLPAIEWTQQMQEEKLQRAKELVNWKKHVQVEWSKIVIEKIEDNQEEFKLEVGNSLTVQVLVFLGELKPSDVVVEIRYGAVNAEGEVIKNNKVTLTSFQDKGKNRYCYVGDIPCSQSGKFGYNVRILPFHKDLTNPYQTKLILWG